MKRAPDRLVAGRFRLTRQLGQGGMGEVWLARDERLATACAVKFLRLADLPGTDAASSRARFEREAKAAAQLRSPNVVQILDHGEDDGEPYIAMELLEGEDLAARLARETKLSPAETARVVGQLAKALGRAHAVGLVHRDLKPANIFVVPDEDGAIVKILDFGIAESLSPVAPAPLSKSERSALASTAPAVERSVSETALGTVLGTPLYMSPEQMDGVVVDLRADLWSLGVVAFECLTGRLPFEARSVPELYALVERGEPSMPSHFAPELPIGVDAWTRRALARAPNDRFASARDLADALDDALGVAPSARERSPERIATEPPAPNAESALELAETAVAPPPVTPAPSSPAAPIVSAAPSAGLGDVVPAREIPRGRTLVTVIAGAAALAAAVVGVTVWQRHSGDSRAPSPSPTEPPSPSTQESPKLTKGARVVGLDAGDARVCALFDDKHVACWGKWGGVIRAKPAVMQVKDAIGVTFEGLDVACFVHVGGAISCDGPTPLDKEILSWTHVRQIDGSGADLCAVLESGRVRCTEFVPAKRDAEGLIEGVTGARAVATGRGYACAIVELGKVRCWGRNSGRVLGHPPDEKLPSDAIVAPSDVGKIHGATALSVGPDHACALGAEGEVVCWGNNDSSELGRPHKETEKDGVVTIEEEDMAPLAIPSFKGTAVATGWKGPLTCATGELDGVQCWGESAGPLFRTKSTHESSPLTAVRGPGRETLITAGENFACVAYASGEVVCWGSNALGELGSGIACADAQCIQPPARVAGLPPT